MDPVSLVCSQNRFRRQLSVSQHAQIAVELSRWVGHGGDRRSEDFKRSNDHLTTQAMAASAGVSEKTANQVINEEKAKNTAPQYQELANDSCPKGVYPTIVIDLSTETLEELGEIQPLLVEDAFVFIAEIASKSIKVVIPPKKNRLLQQEYDKDLYKRRNVIERFIGFLKQYRRVATRYDKLAGRYLSFVYFAAIVIQCRSNINTT